ncbi:GIN domain-containing protein [Aequorivita capsosiphonis]|uniref:GIN domain-containing protein n=1 Tax=Aequorivita capsosiphonis TaxID=487317 RepID=UPI00047EF2D3|nr:DUF2807 domain-containing protein [Aequorivita capsosiphonis]
MNILIKAPLTLLFIFASALLSAQKNNSTSIVGSGNIITRTVNTKAYDVIDVSGSMEVSLEKGNEGIIKVTAEDNVQDRIVVESDGNRLTISKITRHSETLKK